MSKEKEVIEKISNRFRKRREALLFGIRYHLLHELLYTNIDEKISIRHERAVFYSIVDVGKIIRRNLKRK